MQDSLPELMNADVFLRNVKLCVRFMLKTKLFDLVQDVDLVKHAAMKERNSLTLTSKFRYKCSIKVSIPIKASQDMVLIISSIFFP